MSEASQQQPEPHPSVLAIQFVLQSLQARGFGDPAAAIGILGTSIGCLAANEPNPAALIEYGRTCAVNLVARDVAEKHALSAMAMAAPAPAPKPEDAPPATVTPGASPAVRSSGPRPASVKRRR